MYLECCCADIDIGQWEKLMDGAKRTDERKLNALVKRELPELYDSLFLNLYNPYDYYHTDIHWILVHSAIEYFIRK